MKTTTDIREDFMLDLITIPKLNGKDFFVTSYQRGYRWTKNEIAALLNDVAEFDSEQICKWTRKC